jgi:type I restriction enzyme, S subunit
VSELPPGWASVPIADLGKLRLGKMLDKAKNQGRPAKYLRNINVRWFGFDLEDMHTIFASPAELEQLSIEDGDLFVCEGGEPGRCAVWRGGENAFVYQKALHRFRGYGGMVPELLMYRLRHDAETGALAEVFTGTTIKHLTGESLARFNVPVPPLPEQKRIVEKLDALLARADASRGRLDRVAGILKRFRQSVLAAATSGKLTREWREERGLDDAWQQATLGSLLTDVRYGTSKKCAYDPRKTPVLRIPNVVEGAVSHDDMKYADFDEQEREKLALAPGDLLMIRSNGSVGLIGRTALVSERDAGFLYAGYLIRLRTDAAQASPAYLSRFLASPASRAHIELTARSTTGVNNINAEEIRAFPVTLPPLAEQYEIVKRIGELFEIADRLDHRVASAQAIIQRTPPSALAKAFRGELIPQDPNDEPASRLLARLRTRPDSAGVTGKPKRGVTRGSHARAKADTNMLTLKDVIPTHLTTILKERGSLTAEALWSASQLEIDDFYDQLKDEEARGLLRENRGDSSTAPRLLEACA